MTRSMTLRAILFSLTSLAVAGNGTSVFANTLDGEVQIQQLPPQPEVQLPQQTQISQQPQAPVSQQPQTPVGQQPEVQLPQQPQAPVGQQPEVQLPQQPQAPVGQQPEVQLPQQPQAPVGQQPEVQLPQQPQIQNPQIQNPQIQNPQEPQITITQEPAVPQQNMAFGIEQKPATTVVVTKGQTLAQIAIQAYGSDAQQYQQLIAQANQYGISDQGQLVFQGQPATFKPGQELQIPAIERLTVTDLFAGFQFDAAKPGRFPAGQFTFDQETSVKNPSQSLTPQVRSEHSGVIIGAGYDLSQRDADQIRFALISAGMTESDAQRCAQAAGLTGQAAQASISQLPTITPQIQANLFTQEYQRQFDQLAHHLSGWELQQGRLPQELTQMDQGIIQVITDMQFRGDMNQERWNQIRNSVLQNNRAALQSALQELANQAAVQGQPDSIVLRWQARADLLS